MCIPSEKLAGGSGQGLVHVRKLFPAIMAWASSHHLHQVQVWLRPIGCNSLGAAPLIRVLKLESCWLKTQVISFLSPPPTHPTYTLYKTSMGWSLQKIPFKSRWGREAMVHTYSETQLCASSSLQETVLSRSPFPSAELYCHYFQTRHPHSQRISGPCTLSNLLITRFA